MASLSNEVLMWWQFLYSLSGGLAPFTWGHIHYTWPDASGADVASWYAPGSIGSQHSSYIGDDPDNCVSYFHLTSCNFQVVGVVERLAALNSSDLGDQLVKSPGGPDHPGLNIVLDGTGPASANSTNPDTGVQFAAWSGYPVVAAVNSAGVYIGVKTGLSPGLDVASCAGSVGAGLNLCGAPGPPFDDYIANFAVT